MLCHKRYSSRFDAQSTEAWFRNIVLKNPLLFYPTRTDNAFAISMLSCSPWFPTEFDCHVLMACADDGAMWELLKVLRASVEWARKRKVTWWRITSETNIDLWPLARRCGAHLQSPRSELRLDNG
jgi:hypothetical protein